MNQEKGQCGVYQFGKNTASILSKYKDIHEFNYLETENIFGFINEIGNNYYDTVILNHHPCTMSWVNENLFNKCVNIKFAMIMHDTRVVYPNVAILHPDPTFTKDYPDFPVGRPVLSYTLLNPVLNNMIGSFGFGFDHKGFDDLILKVNEEFDEATIRIHIPLNSKVDETGSYAFNMANKLKSLPKDGIKLEITHDYKNEEELLNWLSQNTVNIFLYKNTEKLSQGCSSTTDWALAAKRPLVVSGDWMFRHIWSMVPEICIDKNSIKSIIKTGISPLSYFYENWTERKLYEQYCGVINEIV